MPELPEVETIRRDLENQAINKAIAGFEVLDQKIIRGQKLEFFKKYIIGSSFKSIGRRGKMLIFHLKSGYYLLVHLKMTGQLIYRHSGENMTLAMGGHEGPEIENLPNRHTRVIFKFKNNSTLYFNDQRKFGYFKIVGHGELKRLLVHFGVEPLSREFTFLKLRQILRNKRTCIKNFLLNQKYITGIGNIYADEICFNARVKPDRPVKKLTQAELKRIFKSIRKILTKAVNYRGTTFANYRDSEGKKGNFSNLLKVYGRQNKKCMVCKVGVIQKIKIGQRGTHYCPICQI